MYYVMAYSVAELRTVLLRSLKMALSELDPIIDFCAK
jgi:hypothetical protein